MFTYEEIYELNQLCEENEKFAKYIKRLREENNLLLSKVTHEFGNPLALIHSTAQLIDSRYPEVQDIKYWGQLKSDISSLSDLLHNFSDYNHCTKLRIEVVNLFELVQNTVKSFEVSAMEKKVTIEMNELDKPMDCLLMYACDKVKLRQVFTNIIKNALEATKEGDYIRVTLPTKVMRMSTSGYEREYIKIDIANNGFPIKEADKKDLFVLFVSSKPSCGGLGLPIAQRIVSAHNGTIGIEATEKETTFSVYLPV